MKEFDPAAPQPSSQALPEGTCLEGFAIESVLGSGPFSHTYLARDIELGKLFVLKEHLPEALCSRAPDSLAVSPRDPGDEAAVQFAWSVENFREEAEAIASLNHPGIVRVLGGFECFGTAYFVMPFVEGASLEEQIITRHAHGPEFTEEELNGLLWRMLEALNYLHDRGIYHQGIRPENILLNEEGIPSLIGFSGARRNLCERISIERESDGYTPFEQTKSFYKIGPQSDIYALGATLFKAITGNPPAVATPLPPWISVVPLAQREGLQGRFSQKLLASIDKALEPALEHRYREGAAWWNAVWGNVPAEEPGKNLPAGRPKESTKLTPPEESSLSWEASTELPPPEESTPSVDEPTEPTPPEETTPSVEQSTELPLPEESTPSMEQSTELPLPEDSTPSVDQSTKITPTEDSSLSWEEFTKLPPPEESSPSVEKSTTITAEAFPSVQASVAAAIPLPPKGQTKEPLSEPSAPRNSSAGLRLAGALVLIGILAVVYGYLSSLETPPKSAGLPTSPPATEITVSPPAPPDSEPTLEPEPPSPPLTDPVVALAIPAPEKPEPVAEPEPADMTGRSPEKTAVALFAEMEGKEAGELRQFGGIEMVWCPPGTFSMGSPWNETGRFMDETPHQVTLTRGYWIAKTETTQSQWKQIVEENPSWIQGENLPVDRVTWFGVRRWLEEKNMRDPLPGGWKWSLPTEAQWEYACRAGTTTAIYNGPLEILGERNAPVLDEIAWYGGNSSVGYSGSGMDTSEWEEKQYPGGTAGVREAGGKLPNAWGLHDMLGNVWEWCADWLGPYELGAASDPAGPAMGMERVMRGGNWANGPAVCRSAVRSGESPGSGGDGLGFRCVAVPPEKSGHP